MKVENVNQIHLKLIVMCQTPFYRTSNELKHHFSNIERTRTCSSIGDQTRTPYFFILNDRTSNFEPNRTFTRFTNLQNCSLNRLEHHFLDIEQTQTCSSFTNRTQAPYFWLRTIKLWTLFNPSLLLSSIEFP